MIGSLLHAFIGTSPDISPAVGVVLKFSSKPAESHLTAVKQIYCYLKGSLNIILKYKKSEYALLIGCTDADYAGDFDDRHSTTGNMFLMSDGSVSLSTKKQSIVTLSTAEAEYVALSTVTQEATWIRRLLLDFQVPLEQVTLIMEDNQAAICIARNPVTHTRTKHIDIRYHYVREALAEGTIDLQYCPTEIMVADILTKPPPKARFDLLHGIMGLQK